MSSGQLQVTGLEEDALRLALVYENLERPRTSKFCICISLGDPSPLAILPHYLGPSRVLITHIPVFPKINILL